MVEIQHGPPQGLAFALRLRQADLEVPLEAAPIGKPVRIMRRLPVQQPVQQELPELTRHTGSKAQPAMAAAPFQPIPNGQPASR